MKTKLKERVLIFIFMLLLYYGISNNTSIIEYNFTYLNGVVIGAFVWHMIERAIFIGGGTNENEIN